MARNATCYVREFNTKQKLTWWFKIVHGIARIWRRRRLCMREEKNKTHEEGEKKRRRMRERS